MCSNISNCNTCFYSPYDSLKALRVCKREDHIHKKNCKKNPFCVFGLGEKKDGIWKVNFSVSEIIGISPDILSRSSGAPIGIYNMGATCYLNTMISCLFQNMLVRNNIHQLYQNKERSSNESANTVEALLSIFIRLRNSQRSAIRIDKLIELLNINPQTQQDPQEFFRYLVSQIDMSASKLDALENLFRGKELCSVVCTNCQRSSSSESYFTEIKLPVEGFSNLRSCWNSYQESEIMTGENKYFCSYCQGKFDSTRQATITELPKVLMIQLLRYKYDREISGKRKIQDVFSYPNEIELNSRCYRLVAAVFHKGESAYGGHYVCDVMTWNDQKWWHIDDDTVLPLKEGCGASESTGVIDLVSNVSSTVEDISDSSSEDEEIMDRKKSVGRSRKLKDKKGDETMCWDRRKAIYMLFYVSEDSLNVQEDCNYVHHLSDVFSEVSSDNANFALEIQKYKALERETLKNIAEFKTNYSLWEPRIGLDRNEIEIFNHSTLNQRFFIIPSMFLSQWMRGVDVLRYQIQSEQSSQHIMESGDSDVVLVSNSSTKGNTKVNLYNKRIRLEFDPLLCIHGKGVAMANVGQFKIISAEFFNFLSESLSMDITPLLSESNAFCALCRDDFLSNQEVAASKLSFYEDLLTIVEKETLRNCTPSSRINGYYISSKWISSLRRLKEQVQKDVVNSDSRKRKATLSSFLVSTKPESDESVDTVLDSSVNGCLRCEHGQWSLQYHRRVTPLSSTGWKAILQCFPQALEMKMESVEVCDYCSQLESVKQAHKSDRLTELSDSKCLQSLSKRKALHNSNLYYLLQDCLDTKCSSCGVSVFYLVSYSWLTTWRKYLVDASSARPGPLDNHELRCIHGKALIMVPFRNLVNDFLLKRNTPQSFTIEMIDDYYEVPRSELISEEQWISLVSQYPSRASSVDYDETEDDCYFLKDDHDHDHDHDHGDPISDSNSTAYGLKKDCGEDPYSVFSVKLTMSSEGIVWDPICCEECILKFKENDTCSRLTFDAEGLLIKPLPDPETISNANEGARRSKRKRLGWKPFSIVASSSDTIALIKLKIFEELGEEGFPNHQRLFHNGVELLHQGKSLQSYGILARSELELKIDKVSKDDLFGDTLYLFENDRCGIEVGFGQTDFVPTSLSSSKSNVKIESKQIIDVFDIEDESNTQESHIEAIVNMGFDREKAVQVLVASNGNLNMAIEKLLG